MDPEEAKRLLLAGGVLILEQLPVGSEFGIDCTVHQVGHQFKGVKMIPPGLHLVHYSLRDTHGQQSPKVGFFVMFEAGQVELRVIDPETEEPNDSLITTEMRNKYTFSNLPYFDRHLAPYALDTYRDWLQLTSHLNHDLVVCLQPRNRLIDSVRQQLAQQYRSDRRDGRQVDTTERVDPERCFRFTPLSDRFERPSNCSSAELSQHSFDSSYTLQQIANGSAASSSSSSAMEITADAERRFLGEFQFVFVAFLLCHVYEAFEQWKRWLRLFCHARSLIQRQPALFIQLIRVLHFQLQRVPSDLFVDIVDNDNFLYRCLHELFANVDTIESGQLDETLQRRCSAFKQHLIQQFGWDLDAELDDEAAVVVEQD